jgi:hypothetical protein
LFSFAVAIALTQRAIKAGHFRCFLAQIYVVAVRYAN